MMTTTVCITGDIDYGKLEDKNCLSSYFAILNKFDIKMTIPVTAEAVKDYPERIRYIIKYGHEIAGHGDVHTAFYGSTHDQIKRLQSMIDIIYEILEAVSQFKITTKRSPQRALDWKISIRFRKISNYGTASLGVKIMGFRAPWLQHNENTYVALGGVGLMYDSSMVKNELMFGSPTLRRRDLNIEGRYATLTGKMPFGNKIALDFYKIARGKRVVFKAYKKAFVRPFLLNNDVVELPITNPDDWYLISNQKGPLYKPEECEEIGKIWLEIFRLMQRSKNLFVIQAHPGRMSPDYLDGLKYFLESTKDFNVTFKRLDEVVQELS